MTVELFGMARALAGSPAVEIGGERLTQRELVRALAERFPQLVDNVLDLGRAGFVEPNLLLLDGRRSTDVDDTFCASDRPCVIFLASGG